MKKYITLLDVMIVAFLWFFCVYRGIVLRSNYPDPPISTYQYGETISLDNYLITFSGWRWGDDALIEKEIPDYQYHYADVAGNAYDVRVGFIEFTVEKISEGEEILDLTNVYFSSGAWGNQFDMELFYLLNPGKNFMTIKLDAGEEQQVIVPLVMIEAQFTESQWEYIDDRQIYIDLQYYPEQYQFVCPR